MTRREWAEVLGCLLLGGGAVAWSLKRPGSPPSSTASGAAAPTTTPSPGAATASTPTSPPTSSAAGAPTSSTVGAAPPASAPSASAANASAIAASNGTENAGSSGTSVAGGPVPVNAGVQARMTLGSPVLLSPGEAFVLWAHNLSIPQQLPILGQAGYSVVQIQDLNPPPSGNQHWYDVVYGTVWATGDDWAGFGQAPYTTGLRIAPDPTTEGITLALVWGDDGILRGYAASGLLAWSQARTGDGMLLLGSSPARIAPPGQWAPYVQNEGTPTGPLSAIVQWQAG